MTASLEFHKFEYVCVGYMKQVKFNPTTATLTTTITEFNFFYTPFQDNWVGLLYHHDKIQY